ncbi:MAG: sufD [Acidobacteria bacterium]|nr:sufD [Acidobacteriota bacterium]
MTPNAAAVSDFASSFAAAAARRTLEPAWLRDTRERAAGAFARLGFPTTRDEDWRFTNVAPIADGRFQPSEGGVAATGADRDRWLVPGLAGPVLVFVDGRFAPGLSRLDEAQPGVLLTSLGADGTAERVQRHLAAHAPFDLRSFTSLNTALFPDAAVVAIAPRTVVDQPIQIVFLSSGAARTASFPRALVLAGEASQVRLIETFATLGGEASLTDAVTELVAGPGSVVEHYRLQRESARAYHVGLTQIRVRRSASVASHNAALGGLIARHDATVVLADEGAEATLNGVYVADGHSLVDNHTEVDHAMPHGTSRELFKGILGGRARAVFNGRIKVRPGAQKTDAKQTNKTLLLSNEAQVNTTPQLEILANDVRCTHGATVGQLSADALFYLRARGIGREEARGMLVRAFAGEVLDRMTVGPVRELLDRTIAERLAASPGAR